MNRKILVVDDDPGMVRTLCDILRLRGWESVGVHSGEAAVQQECENGFPVVLMDIIMPGIDGVAALKAIKACRPNARVVLMTAHTAEERIAEAMRAGAADVITKPIDLESLLQFLG
jgi:DNA-binding NtrC family response regulator